MKQPWLENYPHGVPHTISNKYNHICEVLDSSFKKYKFNPAFTNMDKTLTFGEVEWLSRKMASFFQHNLKLEKGDAIALMMPNILQYPIALFASLRLGLVVVNVNPLYTSRELLHQLQDSKAKAIVIFANSASILEKILPQTCIQHIIVTQIGDMLSFPKSIVVNTVIKYIKKMIPSWNIPHAIDFKTAMESADPDAFTFPSIEKTDTAFLQYTGGTTGISKGAVLTHGNIAANMEQVHEWLASGIKEENIVITPLPLYHIFSLTVNCLILSSIGARNILITNPKDIPAFIKELKKWKFTCLTGVNTLFKALLSHPEFKSIDFSSLKLTVGGGMAVQKAVAEKWVEITKCPLIEGYGLTETSPCVCVNPLTSTKFTGSIGMPLPSTDVQIKDDEENNLPMGETGEITVKGPQVMKGYHNRPDETQEVTTQDGYFKTGDMGFIDEKGFVKLVDRKKDMILVSGFNVYPNEIEDVVCQYPKVFEAAAVAMDSDKSGQAIKLFVVKKDDSLTIEELKAFCRKNLAAYKNPRIIEFRDDLPKSNVGKILRKDLRESS